MSQSRRAKRSSDFAVDGHERYRLQQSAVPEGGAAASRTAFGLDDEVLIKIARPRRERVIGQPNCERRNACPFSGGAIRSLNDQFEAQKRSQHPTFSSNGELTFCQPAPQFRYFVLFVQ